MELSTVKLAGLYQFNTGDWETELFGSGTIKSIWLREEFKDLY
jgi:hypothetical protein